MKKTAAIFLILVIIFGILSLSACKKDETQPTPSSSEEYSRVENTEQSPEVASKHKLENFVCTDCGGSFFGRYRKCGISSEIEEIEWIILKKEGNRVLVVSKYALEERSFNQNGAAGYEESSIKSWLNGDFLNTAFSASQQKKIVSVDGKDKIFLLSVSEAKEYFKTDQDRKLTARWWLRDSGKNKSYAAYVNYEGEIDESFGYDVNYLLCIRPAMWVEL